MSIEKSTYSQTPRLADSQLSDTDISSNRVQRQVAQALGGRCELPSYETQPGYLLEDTVTEPPRGPCRATVASPFEGFGTKAGGQLLSGKKAVVTSKTVFLVTISGKRAGFTGCAQSL